MNHLPAFQTFARTMRIPSKDFGMIPFTLWNVQRHFVTEICKAIEQNKREIVCLKARQIGACVAPGTRVLTAALTWRAIETLQPGDRVIAVDEHPPGGTGQARRMRTATVQAVVTMTAPAYRLTLRDGTHVIATGWHPWLTVDPGGAGLRWRRVETLRPGMRIRRLCRTWDAGEVTGWAWLGGLLDGEGSFRTRRHRGRQYAGTELTLTQAPGPVLDRAVKFLEQQDVPFRVDIDTRPAGPASKFSSRPIARISITSTAAILRVLGSAQPTRWRADWWAGVELPSGDSYAVVDSITPIGPVPVVDLQTTTGTYVAEGLVSHNTTVMMAWDAYWLLRHPGMQGQFNANADDNREYFRDVLSELYRTLPPQFSYPLRVANRNVMAWANGSRLMFQTVGLSGKVGRGRGLSFAHSTEMGEWRNQEAIASLRAAFSERHQHALFIWEGTAKGYDVFYDMWMDAQRAVTIHPIFLAWWMHEEYRLHPSKRQDKKIMDVYWDGQLTATERAWDRDIRRRWKVAVTPEQWAWRRWKVAEKMGDEIMASQEFPTLPEDAFQAAGQPFIGHGTLQKLRESLDDAPPAAWFRYTFGPTIERLEIAATTEELAQLTIWEEPDVNAYYVVAADPAYGASAASDRYVCSVWRISRTRMVQVASFVTTECTMNQFAWVTCHLAGAYAPSFFILELNGPGMAVHQEIERLKSLGWGTAERGKVLNALASIQSYIWRRPDGMGHGASWQWRTTPRTKIWILNRLRDQLMQDALVVREAGLVHELGNVRQDGDRFRAEGRAHDDRVIAAALAVEMWSSQALPVLDGLPVQPEPMAVADMPTAHQRAVAGYFRRIGLR